MPPAHPPPPPPLREPLQPMPWLQPLARVELHPPLQEPPLQEPLPPHTPQHTHAISMVWTQIWFSLRHQHRFGFRELQI